MQKRPQSREIQCSLHRLHSDALKGLTLSAQIPPRSVEQATAGVPVVDASDSSTDRPSDPAWG